MPYSTQRANQSQDNNQYASSDNPVFKIKLRGLDNDNEQSATTERGVDSSKNHPFKVGDFVKGKSKKSDEFVEGKIVEYNKDTETVVVLDSRNKKRVTLDYSSLTSIKDKEESDRGEQFKTKTVPESKILGLLNFTEFLKL